jgi:hypothetical protein
MEGGGGDELLSIRVVAIGDKHAGQREITAAQVGHWHFLAPNLPPYALGVTSSRINGSVPSIFQPSAPRSSNKSSCECHQDRAEGLK